jgi:hypothetical protein
MTAEAEAETMDREQAASCCQTLFAMLPFGGEGSKDRFLGKDQPFLSRLIDRLVLRLVCSRDTRFRGVFLSGR